jgi:hypothetical protein
MHSLNFSFIMGDKCNVIIYKLNFLFIRVHKHATTNILIMFLSSCIFNQHNIDSCKFDALQGKWEDRQQKMRQEIDKNKYKRKKTLHNFFFQITKFDFFTKLPNFKKIINFFPTFG